MLLPGFNENIKVGNEVYHVQTGTRGNDDAPYVVTLVFVGGGIIYRRKTEWLGPVDTPEALVQFKELLNEQHAAIVDEVKANSLQRASTEEQKKIEMDERELIARFLDEWASE